MRLARKCGAPGRVVADDQASGRMAAMLRAVSSSVSPLVALLVDEAMLTKSALRRLAAISNEVRVRVLAS